MAITYQSAGTISYVGNSTTLAMTYPGSISVGDLLIMFVAHKPNQSNNGTVGTPTGWTLITNLNYAGGYGSSAGSDIGNSSLYAFSRVADGSESNFNVTITGAANNVNWGQILRLSNVGTWDVAGATGSDTAAGNVSVTFSSNPGITSGDLVLAAMVVATDIGAGAWFSAEAISATSATFGAVTEISEPNSSLMNNIGGVICRAPVTAGTAAAAPVFTSTITAPGTNARGAAVFVRIREIPIPFSTRPNPRLTQAVNRSYSY